MEQRNQTSENEFLITGFVDLPHLLFPIFFALLLIYMATLVGNVLIMAIVYSNKQLHTPMYFFLSNLAFIDITYTTTIFPKMLADFFLARQLISFTGCLSQMYFFMSLVSVEFFILAVMAYDRYVAICNPLRYINVMNNVICIKLAVGTWIVGFIDPIPHTALLSGLSFCGSHTINHFFCDVIAVMALSCSSTATIERVTYFTGVVIGLVPFVLIMTSYINIISTILKIRSTEGRHKAFSTCASHLTVVILLYGSILSTYMRPTSIFAMNENRLVSLSYVAVTPLCNPIIYSLKNNQFKNTLRKTKNRLHS
ncbi:olfactory receptor 5V1-like [Lissotriton helveticus]